GFAAHVSGEHSDDPAALALYAWLLNCGGQGQGARRLLGSAPAGAIVSEGGEQLDGGGPPATEALSIPPARFAPYASGAVAEGTVVASATLIDGGRRALAPAQSVKGTAIWVRNGLGQTTTASVERRFVAGTGEIALLRLDAPLP